MNWRKLDEDTIQELDQFLREQGEKSKQATREILDEMRRLRIKEALDAADPA